MRTVKLRQLCGSLVLGGFDGTAVPSTFGERLRAGELGGAIVFARNLTPDLAQVAALTAAIARCSPELPPIVSVDQEGGRVARLKTGVVRVPPALVLGRRLDVQTIERVGAALGRGLAALGFSDRKSVV